MSRKLRLCRIVTVPITFTTLLSEQIKTVAANNIELTLVCAEGAELEALQTSSDLPVRTVNMTRKISPLQDIRSIVALTRLFQRQQFDIVHSSTPKAGLLAGIAGWIARVPVRLHTYTGQVWVEMSGFPRFLTRLSDRIIAHLNTYSYADSHSQRKFLIEEGIVAGEHIAVLASGSISGVDLTRFNPERWQPHRAALRRKLGIPEEALVILFVGRVTRDKGIIELLSAFNQLQVSDRPVHLLLVGPFEPERDPLPDETRKQIEMQPQVHALGFTQQPEQYMAISDLFCLPSYREGFGSVVIEAAAAGIPAVVTDIVGARDTVINGTTGILVPAKDDVLLADALSHLLQDNERRIQMGQAARERAVACFNASLVNQAVADEYFRLAEEAGLGIARPTKSDNNDKL